MITDAEYVLADLRAHPNGRDAMQIISASIRDRGVGATIHSRVADLRAQGFVITCAIEGKTRKGRERYVYRLVSEPGPSGVVQRRHGPSAPSAGGSDPASVVGASDRVPVEPRPSVEQEQPGARMPAAAPLDAPPVLIEIEGQLVLVP